MRTRQPPSRVRLRWRCDWMFLSVPQTYPFPNCWIRSSLVYPSFRHRGNRRPGLRRGFPTYCDISATRHPPRPAEKRASLPSRGRMELVAALRQQTDHPQPKTKRSRPEGGGFRWICVLDVGLEEDDAADLEQIPIVEALAYMLLAEGDAAIVWKVSVMPVRSRSIS